MAKTLEEFQQEQLQGTTSAKSLDAFNESLNLSTHETKTLDEYSEEQRLLPYRGEEPEEEEDPLEGL